jgi:hypothetical protein
MIVLNSQSGAADDPRLRRAIAYATDRGTEAWTE